MLQLFGTFLQSFRQLFNFKIMGKHNKKEKTGGKFRLFSIGSVSKAQIYCIFWLSYVSDNCPIDVEKYFSDLLSKDESLSAGIAAIRTLLEVLKKTKCEYL